MAPSELTQRRLLYGFIAILAVAATLFGLSNGRILGVTPTAKPTALPTPVSSNPVDTQPAPELFREADLLPVSSRLGVEARRASSGIKAFYADQPKGAAANDAAFVSWAVLQIGTQPLFGQRSREKALILDLSRSAKRDESARWLGLHGCRDVWTSYALEQQRFRADDAPVAEESELASVLDLAARVATAGQKRFSGDDTRPPRAPCTTDAPPPLTAADCRCSYPSAAAAMSAAARTYLAAVNPKGSREYAWMERQVDMAAVYQGVELPSDVGAGAYLGYLTGRYFLASRGLNRAAPTATASPGAA
jgi:hypothetical protein